ncbi:MAG TPA: hypothetical protein VME22_01185 [Solirubrobacteraceae bacterium]|nr:hypothetical protein [Solirubrobacteraceae bacterium]
MAWEIVALLARHPGRPRPRYFLTEPRSGIRFEPSSSVLKDDGRDVRPV